MVQDIGSEIKVIIKLIIMYNRYDVLILDSSNQAIGCIHHQRNTVSHSILRYCKSHTTYIIILVLPGGFKFCNVNAQHHRCS